MRQYIYISVSAVVLIVIYIYPSLTNYDASLTVTAPVVHPKPVISFPPPELLGRGARLPTAIELEQEKIDNDKQVRIAIDKLKSPDSRLRIAATEQLNAYQTQASEQQLADTLTHDVNPEVRKSAALSLSYFSNLSDRTLNALLKTLNDDNEATRFAILNTLLAYSVRVNNTNPERFRMILGKLRNKARSRHLAKDVRVSLQAFIKDQEPVKNIFFPAPVKPVRISH